MIAVAISKNSKIGHAAATYAPIKGTCPPACAMREACYATTGHVALANRRAEVASEGLTPRSIASLEARAIDRLAVPRHHPIRLHVSGDTRTKTGTAILAKAITRYQARGGGPAWTYTHAWRTVARSFFGPISVLASYEGDPKDLEALTSQGFAPARVVTHHNGSAPWQADGITWIPCPEQTMGVQCTSCKLCWNDKRLLRIRHGIAFALHGTHGKRALKVVQ